MWCGSSGSEQAHACVIEIAKPNGDLRIEPQPVGPSVAETKAVPVFQATDGSLQHVIFGRESQVGLLI